MDQLFDDQVSYPNSETLIPPKQETHFSYVFKYLMSIKNPDTVNINVCIMLYSVGWFNILTLARHLTTDLFPPPTISKGKHKEMLQKWKQKDDFFKEKDE